VDSYSGFYDNEKKHDTGLKGYLDSKKVDEVYITGIALDYCVKATAIDAVQAGFKTFLVIDACRAVDLNPGDEGVAISDMLKAKIGIIHSIHV
jgi:nicotinamidase/pyrazinamidase